MTSPPAVLEVSLEGLSVDVEVVDAVARLALAARRAGCRIVVREATAEAVKLFELCGLGDLLND